VSRFKALVGVTLASRTLECQQVEALVKSQVLNRMAALGDAEVETHLSGLIRRQDAGHSLFVSSSNKVTTQFSDTGVPSTPNG